MTNRYAKKNKIIAIVGPTAVGKTALSLALAKSLNGEIISGDAMQIYQGMDIGTGKVTASEQESIPHYMLDIKSPADDFSAHEFKQRVTKHIAQIADKDKLPIIVGGTGLYIQAVLYDYQFSEVKRDDRITENLKKTLETQGNEALYNRLKSIDPEQAIKIHPNNYRRVIRALEVYERTGKTMTENHQTQAKTNSAVYDYKIVGLHMARPLLYERINQRVDLMIKEGLVEEARKIYNQYPKDAQALQAIGYKEFIPYFEEEITRLEAITLLKRNSRRYAKRQYTYFENKMNVSWYEIDDIQHNLVYDKIIADCKQFMLA